MKLNKYLANLTLVLNLCCLIFNHAVKADTAVLQRGYTPDVAGANLNETQLTPANVSAATFGRLFSLPVNGSIYAQPLYVPNLTINGIKHNVVIVATMNDIVYAFDADTPDAPLWEVNYANTVPGATPVPINQYIATNSLNIAGNVGIESTPVIDQTTNTLYFVTVTLESGSKVFRLHAVDMTSGAEKFGGSVVISGAVTLGGNTLNFNANIQNQRASLTLAKGQVIIAFGSHEDNNIFYGWVMAYNAANLTLTGVFNPEPANYGGSVWQSGRPPVVDATGFVYLYTANAFSVNNQATADGVNNFAESALKLDPVTLKVVDYFTPANYPFLDSNDLDLSSSGPSLIPGSNVLIGGGKGGSFYLLDTNNLGQMQNNDAGALQTLPVSAFEMHGGPVVWFRSTAAGGSWIYNWGVADALKAFSFDPQTKTIGSNPVSNFLGGPVVYPGGTLALSANGEQNGILWAAISSQGNADHQVTPGMVRAFNANDLTQELWNSTQVAARDDLGLVAKFVPPLVVNGKVYIATQSNQLVIYGQLSNTGAPTVTAWPPMKPALAGAANYLVSALTTTGTPVQATWAVTGLPKGTSGQFTIDAYGRNFLNVKVGSTAEGSYRLNIVANVAGAVVNQAVILNVVNSTSINAVSVVADSEVTPHLATAAIDNNINTFWETLDTAPTPDYPHNLILDLGAIQPIAGLYYLPRQDGCVDGTAMQYEVYVSNDNINWWNQVAGGTFDYGGAWRSYACNNQTYPQSQKISFPVANGRYVKLNLLAPIIETTPWSSGAEVAAYMASGNAPQVSLTSSATQITPGQSVTFTATVTGNNPTGGLQFMNNGVIIDAAVPLSGNVATITTTSLTQTGVNAIIANYWGDPNNYASSSAPLSLSIQNPSTITVTVSPSSFAAGQSIVLTANVSAVNPTGTVQFYANGTAIGSPVTVSNGVASLTTNAITSTGAINITASYSGDSNNAATTLASPVVETVTPALPVQVPATPWIFELGLAGFLLLSGIALNNRLADQIIR